MAESNADHATVRAPERWRLAVHARRSHALLLGAAFWALMIARIAVEGGRFTRDALPVGWDFHVFRSAGALVAGGNAASLYDPAALGRAAKAAIAGDYPVFPFLNPPHFALPFVPLAALPYWFSFACVSLLNLVLLLAALRQLARGWGVDPPSPWLAFAYALASYPVIVGLLAGQSSFLSLWLMTHAAYFALRGQPLAAGLVVGALFYKPQLALGFLVLFAVEPSLRFRALAGTLVGAALSAVACLLVSVQASRDYVGSLGELVDVQSRFRLALSVTGRAFFEQLAPGAPGLARALGIALGVGAAGAYCWWARRERRPKARVAGAVWLTLVAAPHASVYEWTLLVLPLALLHGELEKTRLTLSAAILLVTSYLAPPLAEAMEESLGFAVHLAIPALVFTGIYVARGLGSAAPGSTALGQRSASNRFT
jgi:alpha-1,2-mannosyltransferase